MNKFFFYSLLIFLFVVVQGVLTSCTTKREYIHEYHTDTIYNETKDTIFITQSKVDTIRDYKIITKTDTIRDIQTRVITLKESGDTIREVINNNVYHYVYQKDSINKYQNKIDSLQKSILQLKTEVEKKNNKQDKEVVKEKKDIFAYLRLIGFVICVCAITFGIYKVFKIIK